MKPQPFNLELWLHLGKPDCVWTKNGTKIKDLTFHHECDRKTGCLTGKIWLEGFTYLFIWNDIGRLVRHEECRSINDMDKRDKYLTNDSLFGPNDLMLYLEDKPKTPWIRKK